MLFLLEAHEETSSCTRHVHFGVTHPTLYMSSSELNKLQGLVREYYPAWDISYP